MTAVAPLERFTPELCEALGVERPARRSSARSRGEASLSSSTASGSGWYSLGAPVREFALAELPPGRGA